VELGQKDLIEPVGIFGYREKSGPRALVGNVMGFRRRL
jgi:hypothetical protein